MRKLSKKTIRKAERLRAIRKELDSLEWSSRYNLKEMEELAEEMRDIEKEPDYPAVTQYLESTAHNLHDHLLKVVKPLPSDFEDFGNRSREIGGADCSCGCKWYLLLEGKLGMDWGVCVNPASPRVGLLTFEHMGCEEYEDEEFDV